LMNRMEQVKNSVRNGRQRRGSISNSQRPWKNAKKIWKEHARSLAHHQKTKSTNHGYRRRRRDTN
jgi:hypothetical protein